MHILIGAIVGMVVSVGLTFIASRVINRPLTWKDITASAVAGIIGGAVATATIGVGAASTLRTVVAFSAGGATGSASGQVTDNVLHGEPAHHGVVKATAFGTAIGAATLGAGKAVAPVAGRVLPASLGAGGGHSNALAGAAAGLDDAVVPVYRYVKKALNRDPLGDEDDQQAETTIHDDSPGVVSKLEGLDDTPLDVEQTAVGEPAHDSPFGRLITRSRSE